MAPASAIDRGPLAEALRRIVDPRFVITDAETARPYECDGLAIIHQQPMAVEVLSTDSMSQVKDRLANLFNILPYQDETMAIYDSSNERLLDVDARSQLDRAGWCKVNTVGQLRLGPSSVLRLVLSARPISERALPPGRRLYHLERRASTADAPKEAQFRRLIAFRVRRASPAPMGCIHG